MFLYARQDDGGVKCAGDQKCCDGGGCFCWCPLESKDGKCTLQEALAYDLYVDVAKNGMGVYSKK